jgi:hypothetical protein
MSLERVLNNQLKCHLVIPESGNERKKACPLSIKLNYLLGTDH